MEACDDECADWAWPTQEARAELDTAVKRLQAARFETPDWAAAQHQWRLGQVLWELGDAHHDAAKAAWMQAIAVKGPCQVWQHRLIASLLQKKELVQALDFLLQMPAEMALKKAIALAVVMYVLVVSACPMSPSQWHFQRPQDL